MRSPAPGTAPRRVRKRKAVRDHAALAAAFEEDVLAGRFPAGELFRAAILRQRRDLAAPPDGYAWHPEIGDRYCRLMEVIPFGGEGPRRGQPFQLEPWQVWLVRVWAGWRDAVSGAPRFRIAHIWLPKGNGKSPLAALMALAVLILGAGGERVYSAASTQKQSRHVFDGAREMLNLAPDVAARFGLIVEEHRIKGAADSRSYEPVSSEAGSIEGIRPSLVILDEVHVLPNRKLYDNLRSAINKVEGPHVHGLVTISTAGFDMSPDAIGWLLYCRTRDVLEGRSEDPTLFAFIVEADRKRPDGTAADPFDFETIRQANPNLGVSVSAVGIKAAALAARDVPSERASFETKHLGWWQSSANRFIDLARWDALGNPDLDLRDFEGRTCTIGLDLAQTRDLTAAVCVFLSIGEDGKRRYTAITRGLCYLPSKSPTVTPDYRRWAAEGWIQLTEGEVMDYVRVREDVAALCERFPGSEICYDPWSAQPLANEWTGVGITCVKIRQGAITLSAPLKELEAAILDGRITHDGNPVMSLCMSNLIAISDANQNLRPGRENEHKKIDVAVALVNAMVRATLGEAGDVHVGDLLI